MSRTGLSPLAILFLVLFITVVYVSTVPFSFSEGEDSLSYLLNTSSGKIEYLANPNHLLFSFLNYSVFLAFKPLFPNVSFVAIATGVVIASSIINIILCTRICFDLRFSLFPALLFICGTAFSYGYWIYSLQVDTYILPLIFVFLTVIQIIRISAYKTSPKEFYLLGILTVLATISHQKECLLAFIVPVTIFFMYRDNPSLGSFKSCFLNLIRYLITVIFLTFFIYSAIPLLFFGASSISDIVDWSKGIVKTWDTSDFLFHRPIKAIIALFKSIWGGYFLFYFDRIEVLTNYALRGKILLEEFFIGGRINKYLVYSSISTLIISLFTLSSLVFSCFANRDKKFSSKEKTLAVFCLAYIVAYSLFNLWWEPSNIEFWISIIPMAFLLVSLKLNKLEATLLRSAVIVSFIATLFLTNLFGNILPLKDPDKDFWYQNLKEVAANAGDDGLVILSINADESNHKPYFYLMVNYYKYYVKGDVKLYKNPEVNDIKNLVLENKMKTIYLSNWFFDNFRNGSENRYIDSLNQLKDSLRNDGANIKVISNSDHQITWAIEFPNSF